MKLAHLSDPHLLNFDGVPWRTFVRDKRVTGFLNLALKRGRRHSNAVARKLARRVRDDGVDHVVVTGDLTNLALEPEMKQVASWLEEDIGLAPSQFAVVPGNHDRYTREAVATGNYERVLSRFMERDDVFSTGDGFPYVQIRERIAIMGLDSAVPRPPFIGAGEIGARQCSALRSILLDRRVASRTPVVVLHHPPQWTRPRWREWVDGLRDAAALRATLPNKSGLLLHGHSHQRSWCEFSVGASRWFIAGAASASDRHGAAYNTYEFDDDGALLRAESTNLEGERVVLWSLSKDGSRS